HVREVVLREGPEVVLERGERGVDVLQQARAVLDHDAARLLGGVAVADGVAQLAEREADVEAVRGPHLLAAGEVRQLHVDLAPGVPQQPGHGVVVPAGAGVEADRVQLTAQGGGGRAGAGGQVAEDVEGVHGADATPPAPVRRRRLGPLGPAGGLQSSTITPRACSGCRWSQLSTKGQITSTGSRAARDSASTVRTSTEATPSPRCAGSVTVWISSSRRRVRV